jgi:CHAT domain-containing protein/tetratricopeptide (TPR) repeat protein
MTPTPEVQERIRRYLMGQLSDGAREEFERDLLASDGLFEELLVVEDEIIDEYLAGKLSAEERAGFEGHFLATSERHEKLKFGRAFGRYLSSKAATVSAPDLKPSRVPWTRTQAFRSSPVRIVVCAIVVVAIALGVWRVFFHQSEVDKGLLALNAAYREQRPIESRISRLDYAPFIETRGPGQPERVDALARDRAELTLNNAVNERRDAAAHHALGKVYLAKKQFDDAIRQFEEALKGDPKNPQLYSDLGAASLEIGKIDLDKGKADPASQAAGNGMEELARSLETLNKALELNPNLLEALFNRALCRQYMMLPSKAEEDWREYLKRDSTSPWAEEARRKLKLVSEREITTESPTETLARFDEASARKEKDHAWEIISQTREMITGRMVAFQLARRFIREAEADRGSQTLAALAYAGNLEEERSGDRFVTDLARYYSSTTPTQRELLARAHTSLDAAYLLCIDSAYEKALTRFVEAQLDFSKAGDRFEAEVVDYWIAYCDSQADRISASVGRLEALVQKSRGKNYKWCESQALCLLANGYDLLGEHSRSITYNEMALRLAEQLSDTYNQQKILTQIAIEYTRLGRPLRALTFLKRSLELASDYPTSLRQRWRNYAFGSQTFYSLKLYEAAGAFEESALQLATEPLKSPSLAHLSRIHLAMIYAGMQRYEEAQREAEQSLRIAQSTINDPSAPRMISYSTIQLAHLKRQAGDCDAALALYNRATNVSESMEFDLDKYDAHKGRLLCYESMNNERATAQELDYVVGVFEKNRGRILEKQNRDSFFDSEQSVYDVGMDYAFKKGDWPKAFWFSEASRARSLLDSLHERGVVSGSGKQTDVVFSSVSRPLDLDAIRSQLPEGLQVVQYNVLKDRLLIWTISKERYAVVDTKVPGEDLNKEISAYVTSVAENDLSGDAAVKEHATALYHLLIAPIESELANTREICFIPDKALFYLPFASLISPATGNYLITRYSILFSPSATVLVLCSRAARARALLRGETLLSVGNPSFDAQTYSDLPLLPAAEREASEVAGNYEARTLLIGPRANKESVLLLMHEASVIHLACHYLPDESSPMNSKLLLAATNGSSGPGDSALSASEILARGIPRARLVVLSGCRTGLERYFNGEGMVGLSEAFLAAGAPLVVASQWSVDSEATAELMSNFHRHRKQDGLDTATAMQRAQVDMLSGSDGRYRRPYYWAAFLPIGGFSTY